MIWYDLAYRIDKDRLDFNPPWTSDVTGPVGAKFDLQNQPISNLKLRTGSLTGSTGSTRWYLVYCRAWHSVESRSIVGNDIFDRVFLIFLIFLITLIALIALPFLPIPFLPTPFLPTPFFTSFLIYIALCIRILLGSSFSSSFGSSFFLIEIVNVRIDTLLKGLWLWAPVPRFQALVCFNDVSFKVIARVSNQVFCRAKYSLALSGYK